MKFLVIVPVLVHLFLAATKACTEIRVTAEDNSVVVGRSLEFLIDLMSYVIVEPKGHSHTALLPEQCARHPQPMMWQNKHSIAYLDGLELPNVASDGQNGAGLSVSALLLPGFTKYQDVPVKKCGTSVSSLEFPLWILGNFKTVKEVRDALKKDSFPLVWEQKVTKGDLHDYSFELHYSIMDKTGDGIIIEFTNQGRKVHNNTVGVMTNSPPYDFHMLNLRNYVHLSKFAHDPLVLGKDQFKPIGQGSGLLGLPGDLTPPSRLVRAAAMVHFSDPVKTAEQAVNLAFHIMNTVDIPRGVAASHDHEDFSDYTSWIVVKDLNNKAMYFRSYEDLTIRVIHLDKVTPGQLLKFKVGSPIGGFVDVTDELKPANARTEL
ncbi:penicillin V acylase-like [Oculina patagonica]